MRTELLPFDGKRVTVTGVFIRFDWFQTKRGPRRKVLLKYVKDTHGRFTTQHASLSDPSDVRAFEGFGQGDVIQFSAIVHTYKKGYHGESTELIFAHPVCIDYGFREVQGLTSSSSGYYRKMEDYPHLIQELNNRKKVSLGVC